jgi:hypothetical protein
MVFADIQKVGRVIPYYGRKDNVPYELEWFPS